MTEDELMNRQVAAFEREQAEHDAKRKSAGLDEKSVTETGLGAFREVGRVTDTGEIRFFHHSIVPEVL